MAVKVSVVLNLILTTCVLALVPHHENAIYFVKKNVVFQTQSKWLSTFLLSFEPYYQYCDNIMQDIEQANTVISQTLSHSSVQENDVKMHVSLESILLLEQKRLTLFESNVNQLRQIITNLHLLIPQGVRHKRSVIPFIGNVLSTLFGTLGPSDLNKLQKKIAKLAKGQMELNHIVENSLTILNVTHMEVSKNRKTINELIDVSTFLSNKLTNVTENLNEKLTDAKQHAIFHFQIYNYLNTIGRSLSMAFRSVNTFQLQINSVLNHQINPSVISPGNLQSVLYDIQKLLPKTLHLPFHPDTELFKYFQTLTVSAVPHSNGLFCIMQIPILDISTQYDLYDVLNIPIPFPNSNLTAQYELEFTKFAISADRTKVSFVTDHDFIKCSLPFMQFCALDTPIRYVNSLRYSCLMSLFLGWTNSHDNCNIIVKQTNAHYPMAY